MCSVGWLVVGVFVCVLSASVVLVVWLVDCVFDCYVYSFGWLVGSWYSWFDRV